MSEARHDVYQEPLVGRYTSKDMQRIFSDDNKFQTWRACWIALAESERETGLQRISESMISEMKAAKETIDYAVAAAEEKRRKHDVMSHVYEFGTHCPNAKGIIHLGATSMDIDDNTVLVQHRDALKLVKRGLVTLINNMAIVAEQNKGLACLAFTHYQPAQPTTMGKRFCMYVQDLLSDLDSIEGIDLRARGLKGATGTQASYLELFDGDYEKVKALDLLFAKKIGFDSVYPVTSQTYPRKVETKIAEVLAGIGVTMGKFATDMRLLSNQRCVDEPFDVDQIGSSAMAYKRNPMRCERVVSLSRKLRGIVADSYDTAMDQWLERTLDDSAIRRMDIPQSFLLADAILILGNNITGPVADKSKTRPLTFYPARIARLLDDELQFSATEAILMDLVERGYDRQEMHEIIRQHSVAAAIDMKEKGMENNLFERLREDFNFPLRQKTDFDKYRDAKKFTGAAEIQTEEFLEGVVKPRLAQYKDMIVKTESKLSV